jgi:hypothetical protein
MNKEMLEALLELLEAHTNMLIGDALGRDTLTEFMRFNELKQNFIETFS